MAAGNSRLETTGKVRLRLEYRGSSVEEEVFLVKGLSGPLLGKPAISGLHLLQFIDEIESTGWKEEFPSLFEGLGTMKSEVRIQLRDDVPPFVRWHREGLLRRGANHYKRSCVEWRRWE